MAGEYGWGGLGGGLGGPGFPDILTALGTALLSSPRDAPFANLPQTLQTATQAGQQRQSNAAMALALTKAGVDPETAATLSMNPTAASLMVAQQNQQRILDQNKAYFGAGAGNLGLGAPPPVRTAPAAPAPSGAPASPVSAAPGMNPFTSLVMRAEGTDPSATPQAAGFNTTLGYGKFAGGPTDLTGMTVNQVLDLQQKMLSHPENNLNSSAAGGFQVVGKTLRSLRDAGVIGGNDPYNEDTQTKIANHLAQSRGRDVGALRQEWRGLANVPEDKILAAYDAAYGPGRGQPDNSSPQAVANAQPVRVAAAGGKVPVPVPASLPPPAAPPAGGAPTGNSTRDWAIQRLNSDLYQMANAKAVGNDALVEVIKARMPTYTKWLEPTDMQRAIAAAGKEGTPEGQAALQSALEQHVPEAQRNARFAAGGSPTEDPATRQTREIVKRGLPDTRPDVVRLGEAAQDTPGLVKSGTEAAAAREQANAEAAARAAFSKSATGSAQAVQGLQQMVSRATVHLDNVIKMGGYGWLESNPIARGLAHVTPDLPATNYHATEVERQHFDNTMAALGAAVAAATNKEQGGGNMSSTEQVLARAPLPTFTSADPQVAREALRQFQIQIDRALELDRQHGLYGGAQQPATSRLKRATGAPAAVTEPLYGIFETPYGTIREKP